VLASRDQFRVLAFSVSGCSHLCGHGPLVVCGQEAWWLLKRWVSVYITEGFSLLFMELRTFTKYSLFLLDPGLKMAAVLAQSFTYYAVPEIPGNAMFLHVLYYAHIMRDTNV